MGCNCGQKGSATNTYIYTDSKGKQHSYKTMVEANAAKVRDQHRGSVRVETVR